MYNSIPDLLRKKSVEGLFATQTFANCWSQWIVEIRQLLGAGYSEQELIGLGDHLSEIFRTTGGGGRGQGELSGGGAAWESLICWYINLCTAGSRVVAIKKMSLVPKAIQDAITVNYGNTPCNTESDITVLVFPDVPEFCGDVSSLQIVDQAGNAVNALGRGKLNPKIIEILAERHFLEFEIGIIQCKTNWNDNAQIPMLWDMIYSAGGFRGRNISIGRNNFGIHNIKGFSYSFVTVPSNVRNAYNAGSLAVKRVTNLSGGNYWGSPTNVGVARSIKEIFGNNWARGANGNLRTDLRTALPSFASGQQLDYFGL